MEFDADTGPAVASGPPARSDMHSVAEAIIAKLEASPEPPGQSGGADDTPVDATGMPGADAEPGDETEAGEAPDAIAEALAEFTGKPLYDVTIDGKNERVTLAELRKGYSRQRDYSRKTANLADQRRAVETEREQLKGLLDAYVNQAVAADPVLAEGQATDWSRMAAENPGLYAQRRPAFEQALARLDQARTLQQRMETEARERNLRLRDVYVAGQRDALVRRMPELADPTKRKVVDDEVTAYAESVGFSPAERTLFMDHRLIQVLRDAAAYRKLGRTRDAVAGKRVATSSRTQAPRASRDGAARKSERLNALKRNALRTGRIDDIVDSVMAHLEED